MTAAPQALPEPPYDLPQYPLPLAGTRGVHHTLLLTEPHPPDHARWFAETCHQVEAFIDSGPFTHEAALPWLSFALHYLADALFARLGENASWPAVSLFDLIEIRLRLDTDSAAAIFDILGAFYLDLGKRAVISPRCSLECAATLHHLADVEREGLLDLEP